MKEIVKVLLAEGIDEETIHEVLNIIEENYEIVDENVYQAIKKYNTKQDKNTLMNKAYDNQQKELLDAAKREEKPEDVEILTQSWDGKKVDNGIGKSRNRIISKRNPENKQAQNIMNKGVAKVRAGQNLQNEVDKESSIGTNYANKEKKKLASKLVKQGDKEFKLGAKQMESPLKVTYADGKRTVKYNDK